MGRASENLFINSRKPDMNLKIQSAALFIVTAVISSALYYNFRWPSVEKSYIASSAEKVRAMRQAAENIDGRTSDEALKRFFNDLIEEDSGIAAVAIADTGGNINRIVKNDSLVHSGLRLDRLLQNLKKGDGADENEPGSEIRSFSEKPGGPGKFYLFSFDTKSIKFIAVYVFRPDSVLFIRIIIELALTLLIFPALISSVIMAVKDKKTGNDGERPGLKRISVPVTDRKVKKGHASHKMSHVINSTGIDESELFPVKYSASTSISAKAASRENPATSTVNDALNSRVFDLFKRIYREFSPKSVTLYIKRTEERLSKTYELKGKTFLRVDAPVFESIPLSELTGPRREGAQIKDGGMKIRIPLYENESLIGLIDIELKDALQTLDISRLQTDVKMISREIREFIVINNVIIDASTGFFSSSYLSMKLGEQIYSAVKHGTEFCLLVADLFGESDAGTEQKETMMRILLPVARKATGEKYELFNAGYRIAAIMDGITRDEAETIKKAMETEIRRYRIKLPDNKIMRLTPVVAYTFSGEAGNIRDILEETTAKTQKAAKSE